MLLTGCRQSGKTSLLEHTFPSHARISLDVPAVAQLAEEDGLEFLRQHPAPAIIDEVQYAPQLFRYLKDTIDKHRQDNGLYLLTGSQKFQLMQEVSESLAGRIAIIELYNLSAAELEAWSHSPAEGDTLLEWIFSGGYPELHARGLAPQRFFADYVATYLERDVRSVLNVRSLRDFDRFLRLAAVRSGQLLSMNSFASDLGISVNTVSSWLSVLEASSVIALVSPYYRNLGKRLVKTPKLYFIDTGLACFLAGLRSKEELRRSSLLGPLFETFVLGQILRWYANRALPADVYFYRDHYGHEVDFVIPVGEKLRLIECKWAEMVDAKPAGFTEIEKLLGSEGIVSASVITPRRGPRAGPQGIAIDDVVDLACLRTSP